MVKKVLQKNNGKSGVWKMIKTETIIECDVCHTRLKDARELKQLKLPYHESSDYVNGHVGVTTIEVCNDCLNKLHSLIRDNFSYIHGGYGVVIVGKPIGDVEK